MDVKLLNYGDAARLLQVSEGTLRNWVSRKDVSSPPYRKKPGGRRVYFIESELIQWILEQPGASTVAAKAQPRAKAKEHTIKMQFTAEELQILTQALIQKDINDTNGGAVADYCKGVIMAEAKEVLKKADRGNNEN
ncbi:DNA-binding protein [Candidatus Falkowbacteria bacterium]|nr:DNA-binding protein [Candidatus Falkowbacteria bacterium]